MIKTVLCLEKQDDCWELNLKLVRNGINNTIFSTSFLDKPEMGVDDSAITQRYLRQLNDPYSTYYACDKCKKGRNVHIKFKRNRWEIPIVYKRVSRKSIRVGERGEIN